MSKKLFIKILVTLTASMLITSCSNQYVTTNLDKENFKQYFSASTVKVYNSEQDINARYQFIAAVEGQDCQIKAHHAEPDEVNARTQARQQAFNKNANGVVFSGCTLLTQTQLAKLKDSNDAKQCHAIVICYAKAYAIETND